MPEDLPPLLRLTSSDPTEDLARFERVARAALESATRDAPSLPPLPPLPDPPDP